MRRFLWSWIAIGAFLFPGGFAAAQSTLDALQDELKEAKQQHQDVTTQVMTNFFAQLDPAMASPDTAVNLYQQAGGAMPDPTPVVTQNIDETETEKEARQALDQTNTTRLGVALQLQCGLMHYAALFVVQPNQAGLQDQWVAWLKMAAQMYPQLPTPQPKSASTPDPNKKKKHNDDDADAPPKPPPPPPFYPADVMSQAMRDTLISKSLHFTSWGDKDQGGWTVKDLPKLYRTNILDPLRKSPTEDTLAAWDTYIAMVNADEPDNDHWSQVVYPPLQFDRACDDYTVTPSTEKLEVLVNLIKANPTNPQADDWISRVSQMMDAYRVSHGGRPMNAQAPAPPAPTGNPNVTITTQQQGDATIIITHTNSAPVTPAH